MFERKKKTNALKQTAERYRRDAKNEKIKQESNENRQQKNQKKNYYKTAKLVFKMLKTTVFCFNKMHFNNQLKVKNSLGSILKNNKKLSKLAELIYIRN